MARWGALHPYRAAHAMKLPADTIRADPADTLQGLCKPLPATVSFAASCQPIRTIVEAALNDPELPGHAPICGFASPDRDGTWIVLAYDHRWFDSASARRVMHAWRERLAGRTSVLPPLARARLHRVSPLGLAASASAYYRFRKAWRIPLANPLDFRVTWHHRPFPPGLIPALRAACRSRGVTVTDALLAAITLVIGTTSAAHRAGARRNSLGLAVTTDLRSLQAESTTALGVALGWFPVLARPESSSGFWDLAAAIAAQTRTSKLPHNLAAFASGLAAAFAFARASRSPHDTATWFQRAMPFAAALSNVNLTSSWADSPDILDYLRISPAGPVAPAVFTPTTRTATAGIGLTCRATAISRATADKWLAALETYLQSGLKS